MAPCSSVLLRDLRGSALPWYSAFNAFRSAETSRHPAGRRFHPDPSDFTLRHWIGSDAPGGVDVARAWALGNCSLMVASARSVSKFGMPTQKWSIRGAVDLVLTTEMKLVLSLSLMSYVCCPTFVPSYTTVAPTSRS